MLLNAIIVDDEDHSRKSLFFLIENYCPTVKISGIASSVAAARKLVHAEKIDLAFLDIAMPNEDGFGLIPDLKSKDISVIFTTAYNQHAIRAIKASAVDYLLKPIDIEDLQTAIQKTTDLHIRRAVKKEPGDNTEWFQTLNENLNQLKKIKKLNLSHAHGVQILDLDNLLYVEASDNYSIFHLANNEKLLVSKHLKEYEDILVNSGFTRIHKSKIINLSHLKDYSKKNGLIARLSNNTEHTVARRKAPHFMSAVREYFNIKC